MKKQRVIEIFILICLLALVITGVLIFKHYKYDKPNTYNIVFKDIDSIVKGSPVRFMGINVGYVTKLKRKDGYIICRIRITKDNVKIPDFTRAKVEFNGLGGSKSIELFPPTSDDTGIQGIVAIESLRINDLAGMVEDLVDVAVFMNNFVQEIDPIMIMNGFKQFTDPEIINRVDEGLTEATKKQKEFEAGLKKEKQQENALEQFIDFINGSLAPKKEPLKEETEINPEDEKDSKEETIQQ